ncbi:CarboxypepD_reg-like domain-containing protein, partial [Tangfeifania diversioriginum]
MMLHKFTMALLLAIIYTGAFPREITGTIKDQKTQESIPYANVWIKGTITGTMSDVEGRFKMNLEKNDTLCVSSVGYQKREIPSLEITETSTTVFMQEEVKELSEVTVKPEVSRAKVLLKKIQERKDENSENIQKVNNYKTFERTTVYLAVDSTSRTNRIIGNLDEVTMKLDGQSLRFSPIYLAELGEKNVSRKDSVVYNRKDGIFPKLNQTIESLILLNVVIDMDFYRDQIKILGRGITSPLSNSAQLHYDFYLNDSTYIGDTKYFSFSFTPK